MGYNTDNAAAAAKGIPAHATSYVTLLSLCQILLEFLFLLFRVDAIGLSCLDAICSTTMLVCMISFITTSIIMLCQLFVRIKS
jgi:hypothetical protein